jgi:hypothetical protein
MDCHLVYAAPGRCVSDYSGSFRARFVLCSVDGRSLKYGRLGFLWRNDLGPGDVFNTAVDIRKLTHKPPPAFSFVFGIPSPHILRECREQEIVTIGGAATVDEAVALKAEESPIVSPGK